MRPTPARAVRIGAAIAMLAGGLVAVSVAPVAAAAAPSWSIVPSPNPAGPTRGELDGITCTSTTSCLAVGGTGAYGPFGEPLGDGLTSVTRTGASDCSAVGWWVDDASTRTLIERYA